MIIRIGHCSAHITSQVLRVGIDVTVCNGLKWQKSMLIAQSRSWNRLAAIKEALATLVTRRNYRCVQATYNDRFFSGTLKKVCADLAPLL